MRAIDTGGLHGGLDLFAHRHAPIVTIEQSLCNLLSDSY